MKTCSKCKLQKELKQFSKCSGAKDGCRPDCKECCKVIHGKYYIKNTDLIKRQQEVYRLGNSGKIKEKQKEYEVKNHSKIMEDKRNYQQARYVTDTGYKLSKILRIRLNCAIKNDQKTGSAVYDLGCSVEELKIYLESKWQPEMTWDNWAVDGWHIDHIKPLVSFDLEDPEQLKQACHYTNLQPLWAENNWKKGNKRDH